MTYLRVMPSVVLALCLVVHLACGGPKVDEEYERYTKEERAAGNHCRDAAYMGAEKVLTEKLGEGNYELIGTMRMEEMQTYENAIHHPGRAMHDFDVGYKNLLTGGEAIFLGIVANNNCELLLAGVEGWFFDWYE